MSLPLPSSPLSLAGAVRSYSFCNGDVGRVEEELQELAARFAPIALGNDEVDQKALDRTGEAT
jgi:hypothetical protein